MAEKIVTEYEIGTNKAVANLQAVSNQITQTDKDINKLGATTTNVLNKTSQSATKAAGSFNGLNNSVAQIGRELPNFALNAQTGFLAVSNNLPILFDNLQRVREENIALAASGQKTTSVFKQVVSSIFSLNTALTLIITLTILYGKEIGNFIAALFKGNEAITEAKIRLDALNAAYDSKELKNAVKGIIELNINVKNAKDGFVSKEVVLKQYNETLGIAFGKVTSLDEAEKGLAKNTNAYITAIIQRAASQKILNDSLQLFIDIQREQTKLDENLTLRAQAQKELNALTLKQIEDGANKQKLITIATLNFEISKSKEILKVKQDQYEKEFKLATEFSEKSNKVLKDDGGGKVTDSIKSAFQVLQAELSKTEESFKSAKLQGLDTTAIEKKFNDLTAKIKKVQEAFDELTGEAGKKRDEEFEKLYQSAIDEAERYSKEVSRIADIDMKRAKEDRKELEQLDIEDNKKNETRLKDTIRNELFANEQLKNDELENKELTERQKLEIELKYLDKKIEILKKFKDASFETGQELENDEKRRNIFSIKLTELTEKEKSEIKKLAIRESINLAQTLEQGYFGLKRSLLENETSIALENLQAQRDNKLISEKEFNAQRKQLLNEQAQKQRELDLAQIKVQTALSIIKTLAQLGFTPAGIIAAGFAGVEGAVQYAFAQAQPLPRFAKGTDRVKGGIKGQDSVHALLMPDEAIIPANRNLERPAMAKAWISGDLDRYLTMNYIRPAIEENNKRWEKQISVNQNSQFIRNDNFNDKRIVRGLETISKKLNSKEEKIVYKRNRRLWN